MKKNTLAIMLMVLFAGASFVYAEGMKGGMMGKGMSGGMKDGEMMGKGMMHGKMMGMCPTMNSMMERSVVATNDGGVVVVMGNKLTKYDKDLNVVKEVELKMDKEGMQKMMENMKSMCPMMEKMKSSDESKAGESKVSAQE